jgi:esterase/lipase superfamily enzyme
MTDYVMSVRAAKRGAFTADIGPTSFLVVPDGNLPNPKHAILAMDWYKAVRKEAVWTNSAGESRGDILFIVHGFNNSEAEVIQRHRIIKRDLATIGFLGVVVSFDWPSDDMALAYVPDRHRAKYSAFRLVSDGIAYLSGQQAPSCTINVHVLGHSTGAYVIREAFDDADDTGLPNSAWCVSQIVFAAGDVSSGSMSADDSVAKSIYRHCVRLTNYSNRYDQVLDLSNVKRLGVAPRVGRIGLPSDAPQMAVNVDCSAYYERLSSNGSTTMQTDEPGGFIGVQCHSWYFGNRAFTTDLFSVLTGIDRKVISTRVMNTDGTLMLK